MGMKLLTALFLFLMWQQVSADPVRRMLDSANSYQSVNTRKAMFFADSALKLARQHKDTFAIAESIFITGKVNYLNGDKDVALNNYLEAEKYYLHIKDTSGIIRVQTDLCILYLKIKKTALALQAIEYAIANARTINNRDLLGTALNNKGLIFSDAGKLDSATRYFLLAYDNYNTVNSKRGMAYSLDYLASVSTTANQPAKAMAYLQQSIQLLAACGDKVGEAVSINNIGELLLQQGKPADAIPYFKQAIEKARQIKFDQLEDNAWQMLADCYSQTGAYKEAYEASAQHSRLQDKLVNEAIAKKVEELSARYEANKKEQQNKLLTEQNARQHLQLSRTRILSIALVVIAIMIIVLILQFYNRRKLKQDAAFNEELRLRERAQASAIVNAEENERRRLARELHDGIGQSLAAVRRNVASLTTADATPIRHSVEMIDGAIAEVRQLSHEMMPPWLRNKSLPEALTELTERISETASFAISIDLADTEQLHLGKVQELMLYRCVQEILGNVSRHAQATEVTLEVVNHTNELSLMVYDNGIGFDVDKAMKANTGIGLQNIFSRISYIGGTIDIDSFPGKGTTFNILLPLN